MTDIRPADLVRRLVAFGRGCVTHGDMTPSAEFALRSILHDELDRWVGVWHDSPEDGVELADFLGLSFPEYAEWTRSAMLPGDLPRTIEVACEECGCALFVHAERDGNGNPWWCDTCALEGL